MDKFTVFQKFSVREDALELGSLLEKNGIEYELKAGSAEFNPAFVFTDEFTILIRKIDFEKAGELFTEDVDDDYYLFDFSDEELMEIVAKSDEWSHFDFVLAQKTLKARGKEIESRIETELSEEAEVPELKTPKKNPAIRIITVIVIIISVIVKVWMSIKKQM